jgi:hypothetical protein
MSEMRWAVNRSPVRRAAGVVGDNDEEHGILLEFAIGEGAPWTLAPGTDTLPKMSQDHQPQVPVALEQMLAGLTELQVVLGDAGRAVVLSVRARLIEAMAARDRGDPVAMLDAVGRAMTEMATVGDRLSPGDGPLMAMLANRFQASLLRGDVSEAKKDLDVMFDQSGARYQTKKD